jgi:hypothetical protein
MKMTGFMCSLLMVCVPLSAWCQTQPSIVSSQPQTNDLVESVKVKRQVEQRGIGEKAKVRVVLRNKTEVKGYVSQIAASSFQVTDRRTGEVLLIDYASVDRIKGGGLSKGSKIAIGVAVGAAVTAVSFGLIVASWHGN